MSLLKSFSKRKLLAEKALPADRSKSSSSLKEERRREPSPSSSSTSSTSSSAVRRPPLKKSSSVGKEMKVACLKREVKLLDHAPEPSSGDFGGLDPDPAVNGKVRGEFELSLQASGDEAQHLEQFFAGVDALKEAMRRVKAANRRLRDLHEQAFDVESPPGSATEAHELREAFARLVAKNEAQFEDVRERTLDLKDVPLESDSFRRLKHNILNGTNMKSAQLLLDFKSVLKDHNQRLKEETWRQLKEQRLDPQGNALVDDDDDDDEDDFHDARAFDPNTEQVGDFMQKFVFREKASSAKKYLEEKQRDLEVIEKNMMELNELMKDFAVMVESANEPLDQIDTYLRGTKANMVMVEENLRQAKYKVMGMRKKKLFTALGVAVVVIVVVAVVVGLVCLL